MQYEKEIQRAKIGLKRRLKFIVSISTMPPGNVNMYLLVLKRSFYGTIQRPPLGMEVHEQFEWSAVTFGFLC